VGDSLRTALRRSIRLKVWGFTPFARTFVLARTVLDTTSERKPHLSNFITIENTNLATVTGGGGRRSTPRPTPRRGGGGDDYLNTYADPGDSERPDLHHFLRGSSMPDADREALIRNWYEIHGGNAPAPRDPRIGLA
jgi:hypothetical protein